MLARLTSAATNPLDIVRMWSDPEVWQQAFWIVHNVPEIFVDNKGWLRDPSPQERELAKIKSELVDAWVRQFAELKSHLRNNAPLLLPLLPQVNFRSLTVGSPTENAHRMVEVEAGLLAANKKTKPANKGAGKRNSRTAVRDDAWLAEYEAGDWAGPAEFAETKKVARDTMHKALERARERRNL